GVEPRVALRTHVEAPDDAEIQLADAGAAALLAPPAHGRLRIGKQVRPINDEQRPAVDSEVARVAEMPDQVPDHGEIVLRRVVLPDQDLVVLAVPAPGPVLIRPTKAERQVR